MKDEQCPEIYFERLLKCHLKCHAKNIELQSPVFNGKGDNIISCDSCKKSCEARAKKLQFITSQISGCKL